jgi:hypothetical protein
MAHLARNEILILFDVDGTLTKPRSVIEPDFEEFLYSKVKPRATIGEYFCVNPNPKILIDNKNFRSCRWQ